MPKQDYQQLAFYPEASLASPSRLPGSAEAQGMTVISGQKCLELSRSSGPLGLLVKMLLESSAWRSRARILTWRVEQLTAYRVRTTTVEYHHDKSTCCSTVSSTSFVTSAMPSRHLLFRLAVSMPRTSGTESRLWRTPGAIDSVGRSAYSTYEALKRGRLDKGKQLSLENQVKFPQLWPTPRAASNRNSRNAIIGKNTEGKHRSDMGLEQAVEVSTGILPRELSSAEELPPRFQKMWPTPNAADCKGTTGGGQGRSLRTDVRMWPTPVQSDYRRRGPNSKQQGLPEAVQMWPTPKASGAIMGMTARTSDRPIEKSTHLQTQVYLSQMQMFPTPTASAQNVSSVTSENRGRSNGICLADAARIYPTPQASDCRDRGNLSMPCIQKRLQDGKQVNLSMCVSEVSGQLHPDWVEWMMGIPTGWTDIDADVSLPPPPDMADWWPEEPEGIPRVASGIPNRVDRLKSLGNMVVPQQFYQFFAAIAEIERRRKSA